MTGIAESEFGLVYRKYRFWPLGGRLEGEFRGFRVGVAHSPGGASDGAWIAPSTTFEVRFDQHVLGPPGFRRVGSVRSLLVRMFRRGLVTIGGYHFTARDPDELDLWLTGERLARLWELTDRHDPRGWTVWRNWRRLSLLVTDSPAPNGPAGVKAVRKGFGELFAMVDALRWTPTQPADASVAAGQSIPTRTIDRQAAFSISQPKGRRRLKTALRWIVGVAAGSIPASIITLPFSDESNDLYPTVALFAIYFFAFLIARAMKRSSEQKRWRGLYEAAAAETE